MNIFGYILSLITPMIKNSKRGSGSNIRVSNRRRIVKQLLNNIIRS